MERRVAIGENTWIVRLDYQGQLSFSYIVPYRLSEKATNPLWHSWEEDDSEEISEFFEGVPTNIHPIRIKSKLLAEIAKLINQVKPTFFYFTPTSKQRGRIYTNLISELLANMHDSWGYQITDKSWYYFTKSD